MRIAVVGPTHPYKGGVSQHTTVLAHHLRAAGHDVEIISWASQYPRVIYPGAQHVEQPELPLFPATRRRLHWARPWTWMSEGRRLRAADLVVVAHVTPVQVPAYVTLLRARSSRRGGVVVVCHNVLPHEPTPLQRPLVRTLLRRADVVLTHAPSQAALAQRLTDARVVEATLPPFGPTAFTRHGSGTDTVYRRLLFFGLVRPYKGLDVLLRALAEGPTDVALRVAGEFWGGTDTYLDLCRQLGISDRVEFVPGYVSAEEVPALFADVDALVMPYRSATGSQGPWTAFDFGVPVIVTDVGSLANGVTPGVDGLVVPPEDAEAVSAAIAELYVGDRALKLRAGVRRVDAAGLWADYLEALGARA